MELGTRPQSRTEALRAEELPAHPARAALLEWAVRADHHPAVSAAAAGAAPDGSWPDGSGLDPDEQWIAEASLWKSVPNTSVFQPCTIIEPDTKLPIAPLTWEACGSGCEAAELPRLGDAGFLPAASNLRDGTAVRVVAAINETKVANGWVYKARRFIDLQNGETKGAAAAIHPAGGAESPCSVGRNVETARVSQVSGSTMRIEFTFEPAGGVLWMPAPFPQSETPFATGMAFDIDQPKPRFIAGAGTIYTHEFSAAGWTVLESSAPAEHGVGEAELAVWVEPAKTGVQRLRGWKDDGAGSFTLADSVPNITCKLGLSATSIVGLASDTNDCYEPTSVKLWRAARTAPNTGLTVGPDLPIPFSQVSSSYPIRTWGNYAGLQARSFAGGNVDRLLIVELSTWKMWTIASRAGFRWTLGAFTMDEQHLYALEQPLDASQQFSTLDVATGVVRVPLASLAQSALATPVP